MRIHSVLVVCDSAPTPRQSFGLSCTGGEEDHVWVDRPAPPAAPLLMLFLMTTPLPSLAQAELEGFMKRYGMSFFGG